MRTETEKVVEIIKEAGAIAMSYFEQLKEHHISKKDDGSFLTIADTEVDRFLRTTLEEAFPEYSVLSEESPNERTTEGIFIIDPIDGTKNFAHANPIFGISVGLVVNNIPEIGVIFLPAKNELYVGERGGEATMNGKPIKVSNKEHLSDALVLIDKGSSEMTFATHSKAKEIFTERGIHYEEWQCAVAELTAVARGEAGAMVHRRLNAWDILAGIVIVQAAGGTITHLDGSPKDIYEHGIIATNGILHHETVDIMKTCI